MITNYRLFEAAVKLTGSIAGRTFYHGTSNTAKGEAIMASGLLLPGAAADSRQALAPVAGQVYVTPNIVYGVIYAIGGDMLGSDQRGRPMSSGQYGYLAKMAGSRLSMVLPDEDFVGDALQFLLLPGLGDTHTNQYDIESHKKLRELPQRDKDALILLARRNTTHNQWHTLNDWGADYWKISTVGKKLMKLLPDYLVQVLASTGCALANDGQVAYDELWRFDKMRTVELKKDASNFFDLSERVK